MRRTALFRGTAAVLLAAFPASCYSYQPVAEAPAPGAQVRVRLTAPGALELSEVTDQARRAYEGQLVGAEEDTVRISLLRSRPQSEFDGRRTLRSTLSVPRTYVSALETRTLSTTKTSLVVLAGAGAVVGLIASLTGGGSGSSTSGGGDDGTVTSLIPIGLVPR